MKAKGRNDERKDLSNATGINKAKNVRRENILIYA
jgi:hypothetical protein